MTSNGRGKVCYFIDFLSIWTKCKIFKCDLLPKGMINGTQVMDKAKFKCSDRMME